jgi:hypothetical protein
MRRVGKKIRGVLLSEIENLFSLEDILHLLIYTVRRGVELFAEVVNFFPYLLIVASPADRIRGTT